MNGESISEAELRERMDDWQAELDILEAWPDSRVGNRERIETLREKLRAARDMLGGWQGESPHGETF
jgi:hypothetical protein